MKRFLGSAAVLVGAGCYGLVSPIVKSAYGHGFTFAQVTFSQFFFASLGFLPILLFRKKEKGIGWKDLVALFLVGAVGLGGTSLFYFACLKEVPAPVGLVLLFQFTWMGILLERLVFKKRISPRHLLSVGLILAGTFLSIEIAAKDVASLTLPGILYGLAAALCYSSFLVGCAKLNPQIDSFCKSGVMILGTTLALFLLFSVAAPLHPFIPSGRIAVWGILLGLLGQFLPILLMTYGAPKIGGTATTLLSSMELPAGILASAAFLREPIHSLQAAGLLLILLGIAVSQKRKAGAPLEPKME